MPRPSALRKPLAVLSVAVVAAPATAEGELSAQERQQVVATCGDDFRRVCPAADRDGEPSRERLRPCVREHFAGVSASCQALLVGIRLTE